MTTLIENSVIRALGVRVVPDRFKDPLARSQYVSEVVKVIEPHAPATNINAWVGSVAEKAGGWAVIAAWSKAAQGVCDDDRLQQAGSMRGISAADKAYYHFVRALQEGRPVAEHNLFGKMADRALQAGELSLKKLRGYQIATTYNRRHVYGDREAIKWLFDRVPDLANSLKRRWASERAAEDAKEESEAFQ